MLAPFDLLSLVRSLTVCICTAQIKGEELYKAARRGEEVERVKRAVSVSVFELCSRAPGSQEVGYRIVCSKGTYVRSLIHDLVGIPRCVWCLGLLSPECPCKQ